MSALKRHPASFRDPSGFVFFEEGKALRAVMPGYQKDYERLMNSGLYDRLVERGLLIAHEELSPAADTYKTLLPEQLGFQSMPQEWSFHMLQDAALATLAVARVALEEGMLIKDATPYNIAFHQGRPVFIDTLSFQKYDPAQGWPAFRQFCECFLYPLLTAVWNPALDAGKMLLSYPDGIPVTTITPLLPWKTRLQLNYQLYVWLPARVGARQTGERTGAKASKIALKKTLQNLEQLSGFVSSLPPPQLTSTWEDYYEDKLLSKDYLEAKEVAVQEALKMAGPLRGQRVADLGANTGLFSREAASYGAEVVAIDFDAKSIDRLYRACKTEKITNISPVVADLTEPTPAMGWVNEERGPLLSRLKGEGVLALALIHHLAIGKNIPLERIAALFAQLAGRWAIVEFVPKEDPKVELLLAHREDIFEDYTQTRFEGAFQNYFEMQHRWDGLGGSGRNLYLLYKKL